MIRRMSKYNGENSMVWHDEADETQEEYEARMEREQERADRLYHQWKDEQL